LAVSLCHLCANNLLISKEIREKHITRILRISEGFYADFLLVLQEWMKAQGKVVRRNQDSVMRFLMNNRSTYIPFDRVDDLKLSTRLDYCVQLIGMVAVCAQGENRFGQSVRERIKV
jgi:hypothetical protein